MNPISGSASVVHRGTGTLTLGVANSHSGGITVLSGTLQLSHANGLGTGGLHIHSGAKAFTAEGFDISRVQGNGSLVGESVHAHYYYSSANDFVSDISYILYAQFVKSGTSSLTLNGQNFVERQVQLNGGKLIVDGTLTLMPAVSLGAPITILVVSLDELGNPGLASNFDDSLDYTFILATASNGIHSDGIPQFIVDTLGFQNEFSGTWSAALNVNQIELRYTSAVPEPALAVLIIATGFAFVVMQRRRKII